MAPKADAPKKVDPVEEGDDDDSSDEGMAGLIWVPKAILETVSAKLEKKEEVSKEAVEQLIEVDDPADDVVMVPVDLSDAAEIEDEDNLLEKLGAAKVAELFVQGRKKFLESLTAMPAEAKEKVRQEMTGAEYKKMLEELGDLEGGESELDEDDEEEEDGDDDGEEQAEEPPAKKTKTK
uniref:Uncharacterized protein n=1 Tax=Alexandrium catenella TaxID=2925 RepID=A0A7S1RNN6_ALECA